MTTNENNTAAKKLQNIELKLLKVFHEICEKHNLHYFLIGGTLLGAVRHKGFIPWDDDIDVGMPREDYEILLKNADKWFPKKYRLAHWKNTEQYVYNFAKLEDQDTFLIEDAYKHLTKRKGGVYIDIFPFDGMPSNSFLRLVWYMFSRTINRLLILMYCSTNITNLNTTVKDAIKAILGRVCQNLFSRKKVHALYDKIMKKYSFKTSTFIINHSGMWGLKELVSKEIVLPLKLIRFENNKFYTVKKSDEFLTRVYGDYMSLPPKEKRVSHHNCIYGMK